MPPSFEVNQVDVKAQRRRKVFKVGAASILAGLLLAGGLGAGWYFTPPAMPASVDEARAVVSSPRFTRLSDAQKRPYFDVIREQFGSLDRDERRRMMREDEQLRQTMREAGTMMMRQMLVDAALGDGEVAMPWGRRGGRPGGERPESGAEGAERPERPEPTDAERAERANRLRDHISDRMANGDSQMNQLMREMFTQRRQNRAGGSDGPRRTE